MTQFILTNILFVSAGTMLYLAVRTLPRLGDGPGEEQKQTVFERLVMSDIPNKIDTGVNTFLGKLFRRLKVNLMRFDNYLTDKLKKINTENGSARLTAGGNGNGKNGTHADYIKELQGPLEKEVEREDSAGGK
jgi:hypothetical protein